MFISKGLINYSGIGSVQWFSARISNPSACGSIPSRRENFQSQNVSRDKSTAGNVRDIIIIVNIIDQIRDYFRAKLHSC